jgi:ribosomal protein S18 acetylase RimI-like enzyme
LQTFPALKGRAKILRRYASQKMSLNPDPIELRPATPDDSAFLFSVYRSSRLEDLVALNWTSEQIEGFLAKQYEAQERFFKTDYPHAEELVVLRAGDRLGQMMIERGEREIRMVDLALLPEHRNVGIGTHLINGLLAEAEKAGSVFRVQVMRSNPAVNLFERMGLVRTGETGSHYQLEWRRAT